MDWNRTSLGNDLMGTENNRMEMGRAKTVTGTCPVHWKRTTLLVDEMGWAWNTAARDDTCKMSHWSHVTCRRSG